MKKVLILSLVIMLFMPYTVKYVMGEDIDIYKSSVKPNALLLVDNSWNMSWPVYDPEVDYGQFYDFLCDNNDAYDKKETSLLGDVTYSCEHENDHFDRDRIYLVAISTDWKSIGVDCSGIPCSGGDDDSSANCLGQTGDPMITQKELLKIDFDHVIPGNQEVDSDGNLVTVGNGWFDLGVDNGYVTLQNDDLPHCQKRKLHNILVNPDNSYVDRGVGGILRDYGVYFSGYFKKKDCTPSSSNLCLTTNRDDAEDSGSLLEQIVSLTKKMVFFIANGNWLNMKQLTYLKVRPDATHCDSGSEDKPAWEHCWNEDNKRIKERLTTIKGAIKQVILQTDSKVNWGLADFAYKKKDYNLGIYNVSMCPDDKNATDYGALNIIDGDFDNNQDVVDNLTKINDLCRDDNYIVGLDFKKHYFETFNLGTPIGEGTQEAWNFFTDFANNANDEEKKKLKCQSNFLVVLTGTPPVDDEKWDLISGKDFSKDDQHDNDKWRESLGVDPGGLISFLLKLVVGVDLKADPDYWDDVGYYIATTDFAPSIQDTQNITTFPIGFSFDSPFLEDVAEDSYGLYSVGYNEQQIINALSSLASVIAQTSSFAIPVVSVNTENRTQSGEYIYLPLFEPIGKGLWWGNLKKYRYEFVNDNGSTKIYLYDKNDKIAYPSSESGGFVADSISYWSNEEDGGKIDKGGIGEVLKEKIDAVDLDTDDPYGFRNIYWFDSDGNPQKFLAKDSSGNDVLTNADLGVSDDGDRFKIVNVIYGYLPLTRATGSHYWYPTGKRQWVMGDIIHSSPTIVNYSDGKSYLIVGANDGMLHVFDDDTGDEVAAFVMPDDMTRLKSLIGSPPPHLYFVDAPIVYYTTSSGEKRVVFGERRGGRHYYILNINDSDPQNWTLVKEIGDSEMGYTFSTPVVVKGYFSSGKKPLIFVGGGYDLSFDGADPSSATMGRGIYIIDGDNGNILAKYTYNDNSDLKYPIASRLGVYDLDDDLIPETIYVGDLGGYLWRFNVSYDSSGNVTDISGKMIFEPNSSCHERIFYSPQLSLKACWTNGGPAIYWGTGDRANITRGDILNRVYALIDDNSSSEPYKGPSCSDSSNSGDLVNVTDNTDGLSEDSVGWYINLTKSGEKMISPMLLFNKVLYFSTFVTTSSDPCEPMGESYNYAVDYCNGGAAEGNTSRITNENSPGNAPSSGTVVVIRNGKVTLVTQSGTELNATKPSNDNTVIPLFWRYLP